MTPEEIETLVVMLKSSREWERAEGARRLRQLGRFDVSRLMEAARQERTGQEMANGVGAGLILFAGCAGLAALGAAAVVAVGAGEWAEALPAAAVGGALIWAAVAMARGMRPADVSWMADAVEHLENPEAVTPLLSSVADSLPPLREAVIRALCRLLPRVGIESVEIGYAQRDAMNRIISPDALGTPAELVEAVLAAMARIGDESNLRVVKRLTQKEPWTEGERRILLAARRCEQALERRLAEETGSRVLLRPSAPDAAEELLRPARSGGAAQDSLLRATGGDRCDGDGDESV